MKRKQTTYSSSLSRTKTFMMKHGLIRFFIDFKLDLELTKKISKEGLEDKEYLILIFKLALYMYLFL